MPKLFLVHAESDDDLGSELAVVLRAALPDIELVGPWLPAYAGQQQAWLTSHAVVGLLSQASLQSGEVPFALGGADALEKPIYAVLAPDVAESTLQATVAREATARLEDHEGLGMLAGRIAAALGVTAHTEALGDGESGTGNTRARPASPATSAPAPAAPEGLVARTTQPETPPADEPDRSGTMAAHRSTAEEAESDERPSGERVASQGWVSEQQEDWAYRSPNAPTELPADAEAQSSTEPAAARPAAAETGPDSGVYSADARRASKPTVPGRPSPIAAAAMRPPTSAEEAIVQAYREVEAEAASQTDAQAAETPTGQAPPHLDTAPWPTPAGVPEATGEIEGAASPPAPARDADPFATTQPSLPAAAKPDSVAPVAPTMTITGEAPGPSASEPPSPEDTQELWPVADDATALPDGRDATAPRPVPTRSDVAPAPRVLSAAPGCEASLEAGRAFSDCVFHREQGGPFRTELEVPFGNFVTALGGNWETLRAMDDVDLWMEMADNVLAALPDDRQYVRWWYEVGFQLATLLNLANVDPDSSMALELAGTWENAMEALVHAVRALGMSAAEVAVLEGMLENLRGPGGERDYLNASRVQQVIRERATHADAALSA